MRVLPVSKMTVEEYLAADDAAEIPSEYHDGEVLPIEMASVQHATITANVVIALGEAMKPTPCFPMAAPRLQATASEYVFPDIAVVCGKANIVDKYGSFDNPKAIFEILSSSMRGYDHDRKFQLYRLLPSFEEYVLVSQDEPSVEVFRKMSENQWTLTTYEGMGASIPVQSLGIAIPVDEMYAKITWEV
jgi:Uma2 family endonuclease